MAATEDLQRPQRELSPPSDNNASVRVKMEDTGAKPALTPPTSEDAKDNRDDSGSELSDLEPEESAKVEPMDSVEEQMIKEVDEEIVPDHYYDGGKIPVFKPTMRQFRSFKQFINKIDKYGMKSGIVKVVPPKEWRDSLPPLDEAVKSIRVKNPITQEFHGTHGTYTQANMEKQRSYNLPQWKSLCEESNHQPPAKRGERRRNLDKPAQIRLNRSRKDASPAPSQGEDKKKRGPGRPRVRPLPKAAEDDDADTDDSTPPALPKSKASSAKGPSKGAKGRSGRKAKSAKDDEPKAKGGPKSVSSRRLNNQRDQVEYVDEKAFKNFDYRVHDQDEWTTERMQELETAYWRSLNFNNPMYGADMPGSLFDDSTKEWNIAKLENLLDILGQAVPGVNTAYLYLGMWKASFAWHLEDVDLYSINYIHFGAPKQWYSISQEDARRFESAMKSIWPTDAKNCDQFLRHKTYLISPQLLQSQFNIKVNRLVHYEGEFVITFPYGYHSGYNIGYNCAESVNFATDAWLDYGKVARKCHCEADNVWVDVREIERKLRGEPTPEYYEETDDDDDEDDDDEDTGLPTPPASIKGKAKRGAKRKRPKNEREAKPKVKKLRIRLKAPAFEPCTLCPNDNKFDELLPTDTGLRAHRLCGLYTPETYVTEEADGTSMVRDIAFIDKARLELKCNYCRSKKGSVFQCSSKKCTKAYHATCAMAAGIQIDIGPTSVYGEDGTEYVGTGYDFRCRIHRSKRSKNDNSWTLENDDFINSRAKKLSRGDAVQAQFFQGDLFAGNVIENRKDEQSLLLELLPKGERFEVEWKWLRFFDPVNSQLPVPSENAKPLPADMLRKSRTTAEDPAAKVDGAPKPGDTFWDSTSIYKWSEFESCRPIVNPAQQRVQLSKADQLWYYLPRMSTDAKQYYTHDPAKRVYNPKSNFLDVEKSKQLAESMERMHRQKTFNAAPGTINQHAINAARANNPNKTLQAGAAASKERPYHGKYAITDPIQQSQHRQNYGYNVDHQSLQMQRAFQEQGSMDSLQRNRPNHFPYDRYHNAQSYQSLNINHSSPALTAPMMDSNSASTAVQQPYNSQKDFNFNARQLLSKINMASSIPPLPHQQHRLRPSSSYGQQQQYRAPAPVANMMGSPPQELAPSTYVASVKHEPPAFANVPTPPRSAITHHSESRKESPLPSVEKLIQPIKGVSKLDLDAKYHYLHEAEKARPQVYQSPYAQGGGFTALYLPVPAAEEKLRPRGPSISEAFLMTRSPSEQGTLNATISEDKARFFQVQQEKAASQRPRSMGTQQPQHHRDSFYNHHAHYHPQPSHLPMSAFQNSASNNSQPNSPSYFEPRTHASPSYSQYNNSSYNSYHPNNTFQPPPFHTPSHQPPSQYNQHHLHYAKPNSNELTYGHKASPSLNFQSPHDFREQMQRESQLSPAHDAGFERFSQQLKDAGTHQANVSGPPNHQWYSGNETRGSSSGEYGHGHGQSGSPLRHEFGKADEMLPVMKEEGGFMARRA